VNRAEVATKWGNGWGNSTNEFRQRKERSTEEIDAVGSQRGRATVVAEAKWTNRPLTPAIINDLDTYKIPALRQSGLNIVAEPRIVLASKAGYSDSLVKLAAASDQRPHRTHRRGGRTGCSTTRRLTRRAASGGGETATEKTLSHRNCAPLASILGDGSNVVVVTEVQRPSDPKAWERLEAICAALPNVSDRIGHGEKAWFVVAGKRSRQFATTWDHHHHDRNAVVMAAEPGVQQTLIDADPIRYFRPPYVGAQGWIGIYLDRPKVDWDRVELHLRDAHAAITDRLARK
jgi:hypothetical protein